LKELKSKFSFGNIWDINSLQLLNLLLLQRFPRWNTARFNDWWW